MSSWSTSDQIALASLIVTVVIFVLGGVFSGLCCIIAWLAKGRIDGLDAKIVETHTKLDDLPEIKERCTKTETIVAAQGERQERFCTRLGEVRDSVIRLEQGVDTATKEIEKLRAWKHEEPTRRQVEDHGRVLKVAAEG